MGQNVYLDFRRGDTTQMRHFGPKLGSFKGKTTRQPVQHVRTTWKQPPVEIIKRNANVMLAIDIMVINKIPLVVTTSRNICFGMTDLIPDNTKKTSMTSIQAICSSISRGCKGF